MRLFLVMSKKSTIGVFDSYKKASTFQKQTKNSRVEIVVRELNNPKIKDRIQHPVYVDGELFYSMAHACKTFGISQKRIKSRRKKKWSYEEAFELIPRPPNIKKGLARVDYAGKALDDFKVVSFYKVDRKRELALWNCDYKGVKIIVTSVALRDLFNGKAKLQNFLYRRRLIESSKKGQEIIRDKITKRLRGRLKKLLNRLRKGSRIGTASKDLVGCSMSMLIEHLQENFYPNPETGEEMNWSNYGIDGWHIDHKMPLCSFDLTKKGNWLRANHYTNLQPLWKSDHKKKTLEDMRKFVWKIE